eukprot:TRINITY_DN6572_c0_g1_i1.p1 TRINITY_DN6572_c0_g1~~TRINITY_DN6572_c0_g1_i1.p1  ORF type:complete len:671 (-),score=111.81 TRINITY_DN6572_c0_g1_i1:33-2045(-)
MLLEILTTSIVIVLSALYFRPKTLPPHLQKQTQAIKEGNSTIYRSLGINELQHTYNPKVTTLYELLRTSADQFSNEPCLGYRPIDSQGNAGPFEFFNFREVVSRADNIGFALRKLGAKPKDRIGIYSKNTVEWVLVEHGSYAQNLVLVSFYDTLGEDAVEYIANHAETKIVACTKESLTKLVKILPNLECVQILIQLDQDIDPNHREVIEQCKKKIFTLKELETLGQTADHISNPPVASDLSTIMYTSGTTGPPKGVMLTHANVVAAVTGATSRVKDFGGPGKAYLSYLPLAHIFERLCLSLVLSVGSRVGFYQGDTLKLIDDLQELKPTFLTGVPRIFDRVYDKTHQTLAEGSPVKRFIFRLAFFWKKMALKAGRPTPFFDKLVFNKIKTRLGGRVGLIVNGSAPLSPPVHEFMLVCFGCSVVQGYGLTETSAAGTIGYDDDKSLGNIGPPITCCDIKLEDVPELDALTSRNPPRGELLVRGPNVSIGYFKDPQKTAEDFTDSWFHTGDIGQINPDGTISIVDRKKNIFKLSQGEYIAAEKIEGFLVHSPLVAQIFVHGDSYRYYLIAVVVPNATPLIPWAVQNKLFATPEDVTLEKLCEKPEVADYILKDLEKIAKESKLRGFEFVKKIHLSPYEFSVQNGLLTPTFKLKRHQLKEHFSEELSQLYSE